MHEPLRQVRMGLLRLHKALIDSERTVFEEERGRLTSSAFLQALMEDDFFGWLRPYSGLIVEIDEALADRDSTVTAPDALRFSERVAALVSTAPVGVLGATRLEEARRRDPGVMFSHAELNRSLAAALERYRGA